MSDRKAEREHAPGKATGVQERPGSAAGTVGKHTLTGDLPEGPNQQVHRAAARGVSSSGTALPYLSTIQRAFGSRFDLSAIQAHIGGDAQQACHEMGATAFATGSHVAFASAPDLHTAAHEAAHVVQQRSGVQVHGGVGAAGDSYERQADAVADAVVRGESAVPLLQGGAGGGGGAPAAGPAVQRKENGAAAPKVAVEDEGADAEGEEEPWVDASGPAPSSAQAPVQRKATEHLVDDKLDYNGQRQSGVKRLIKTKKLYQGKGSTLLGKIKAGRNVIVVEEPRKATIRSYAKVQGRTEENQAELQTGYINTKNALVVGQEHVPAGVVMPEGTPHVEDVVQGTFGDCYLLAALIALVQTQPDRVRALFETDPATGAEQHRIRLYNAKTRSWDQVTVKNTILRTTSAYIDKAGEERPQENVGSRGSANWPALIEKAWSVWDAKPDTLSGGHGYKAMTALTGAAEDISSFQSEITGAVREKTAEHDALRTAQRNAKIEEAAPFDDAKKLELAAEARSRIVQRIIDAVTARRPVTAETMKSPPKSWTARYEDDGIGASNEHKSGGITFGHEYAVARADESAITLRNPWARYGRADGKVDLDSPLAVLTWDEFFEVCTTASFGPVPAAPRAA